jgi:hypothetical protein
MSYEYLDALNTLIDQVPKWRREILLSDASPSYRGRSAPKVISSRDIQSARSHQLISDLEHRDMETEIEGSFAKFDTLSPLNRQLSQEENVRADFLGNRVTKVVKRRDPEFQQGTEQSFVVDKEGMMIPVSDDEMKDILDSGEEDIYRNSTPVSIEDRHFTPRDRWDLVFDASEFLQEVRKNLGIINSLSGRSREKYLERMTDEHLYSANIYPPKRDKRIRRGFEEVARDIGKLDRDQLLIICNHGRDVTPEYIRKLRREAWKMKKGRARAAKLEKAAEISRVRIVNLRKETSFKRRVEKEEQYLTAARQELFQKIDPETRLALRKEIIGTERSLQAARKKLLKFILSGSSVPVISRSERASLWSLWIDSRSEETRLPAWKFERLYRAKLTRRDYVELNILKKKGDISDKEYKLRCIQIQEGIREKVSAALKRIYK